MNKILLALLVFFLFTVTAHAETDQELLFAKTVLAITRTGNFNDYMNLWHPSCNLDEKSAALVSNCQRVANCSQPSPEQRDLHTRRNLLGLAQIADLHMSPVTQLDQSGLPKELADKVTDMLTHFTLKPEYYLWANVIHPQYGQQVAEIGYAVHDENKFYIVDGNCMDRPVPVVATPAYSRPVRSGRLR
jgi:hypothetical protein